MGKGRRAPLAIELRLLGPLEAARGAVDLGLGGPKPRALLALLALDVGRVVSADRLVEELWPGTPPESAQHAVQVYVSQLRKALGEAIVRQGPGYVLQLAPDAVDVHRFTRLATEGHDELRAGNPAAATATLREALALWRGPALADFAYEPFAQQEIARLDDLRFAALEDRIDADLGLGRHAELIPEIEALVEAQPLRERPRALLMRALYLAGRQSDALAAYRAARETLVEELGIDPGPELRHLEAAILRQDESLLPASAAPVAAIRTRKLAAILSVGLETGGSADLEAEERDLDRAASAIVAAVTRHGGIAERLPDGSVTAVFGVPVAHEDDPLRAARAAAESRAAVAAIESLRFVAAIEVGEVVAAERSASGPPVRGAAALRQAAADGEIVLSAAAAGRIDHAARLETRGETLVLVELAADAPAFTRRLDARLVGRKRELAALRTSLRRAVDGSHARLAVVTGPPGVGKSRLAEELTRRARDVRTLSGRCLSYGDGITYWPLREAARQAPPSDERDAVLSALEAETPPPAPEIALLFRRLCEALAREKPLVLALDDVHWAEPTFLELVEGMADRGHGPILVLCAARDELLEERPAFLEGRENAERIALEGLSRGEMVVLLDRLGGSTLDADQRDRIVEAAEGNPFFLEELLALALEGGLVERPLPETVQALLAARLDRLGPGQRAVLERGAVVGKEFSADDVAALLEPDAVPTAETHLRTLADRGFLRGHDGSFAYRHVLVQEAVYRAAPKRLRAELHERFADRLDAAYAALPELDELVGYHLEQAYRLRTALGESDRRVESLAGDAGRRLGAAGFTTLKRGDMPATVALLGRATALLPAEEERRNELMCELGIAQNASGDGEAARRSFDDAVTGALRSGSRRIELRARMEAAYARLLAEPDGAARELLRTAESAIPILEALGDDRSLARAWLLIGYVRGGIYGDHAAWREAEERALRHYRSSAFPPSTCMQQIAAATYWGPTPVGEGIERCTELLADDAVGYFGRAAVTPYLAGLHAQVGRFVQARELVAEAEHICAELGAPATAVIHCGTVRADIEVLAEDLPAAERTLREQCEFLERMGDRSHLAVRAAKLAETLVGQGKIDEAEHWMGMSSANAARDDRSVQLVLGPVEARVLARRGLLDEARDRAEETVRLADGTDGLNQIAAARLALAEVLRSMDLASETQRAIEEAIELFERKGNAVGASSARALVDLDVPA